MGMVGTIVILFRTLFSRPMTVKFPYEAIGIPEAYRGEHELDRVARYLSFSLFDGLIREWVVDADEG